MGLGVTSIAQDAEPKGFVVDKIIAKVDNYIILRSELEGAYQNYLANGGTACEAWSLNRINPGASCCRVIRCASTAESTRP